MEPGDAERYRPPAVVPLRKNRDFVLLQAGQLLSSAGSQMSTVSYPLLVLALTGSPAKAGVVAFARLLAMAVVSLPAGLAADRWNRRRLMIGAHVVRSAAVGGLAAVVLLDAAGFWLIPLVAFVEGGGGAVFAAAQAGAFKAVVPARQLPAAMAVVTGRDAAVSLAAPPVGGVLFVVARAAPFVAHAASYVLSTVTLLAMRTPFQEERERDGAPLRARLAEGFHFLWGHPFLRASALVFGLANFVVPGLLFAVVVVGRRQGLSGGEVGLLLSAFGACLLLGAFLSPLVRRLLPVHGVLLLELWTYLGCGVFLVWPNVYVLTATLLPTALAIPATDSVVHGYQLALTPDRLLGRVGSVRTTIALSIAPLGPLAAGLLLDWGSARAAIGLFAAVGLLLALWATLSPGLRAAPGVDELPEPPLPEAPPAATA